MEAVANAAPSPLQMPAKATPKTCMRKASKAATAAVSLDGEGAGSGDERAASEPNEGAQDTIVVLAHVRDAIVPVHCGFGTQQVLWLAHVAVARAGEERGGCQGWRELGVPTGVRREDQRELRLTDIVCEVLRHRSHVYVATSIG